MMHESAKDTPHPQRCIETQPRCVDVETDFIKKVGLHFVEYD